MDDGTGHVGTLTDMEPTSWPRVYRVTLFNLLGDERDDRTVLTFLGPNKAIALAVEAHYGADIRRLWGRQTWPVYDLAVDDIGPAPPNADGTVGSLPGMIEDRAEF